MVRYGYTEKEESVMGKCTIFVGLDVHKRRVVAAIAVAGEEGVKYLRMP